MALVSMKRVRATPAPPPLGAREHLLLKKSGDRLFRHAVVLSAEVLPGCHWVLTPGRMLELVSFTKKDMAAAKIWDGAKLPASLNPQDAVVASSSKVGDFTAKEIGAACVQANALGSSRAVGTRVKLAAAAVPLRRMRAKGPGGDSPGSPSAAGSPLMGGSPAARKPGLAAPLVDDKARLQLALTKRLGAVDVAFLPTAAFPELFEAIDAADALVAAGRDAEGIAHLRRAVAACRHWGAVEDDVQGKVKDPFVAVGGEDAAGRSWFSLSKVGPISPGDPVDLSRRRHVCLGDLVIFENGPRRGIAFSCSKDEVAGKLREFRINSSGFGADRFEGLTELYAEKDGTPRGTAAAETDQDLRVLPAHFECDGRRHRRLEDCQPKYSVDEFEDWPIDGDRSLQASTRDLRRAGLTWLLRHESWVAKSGVSRADRSFKEHAVLCRALRFFTTFDQLNLPNLAGCETLDLRRQLIERAHDISPNQPSYEGAEEFMGIQESSNGTVVDHRRVAYWAARMQAKAKVLEHARKSREERAAAQRNAAAAGKVNAKAAGKGKDAPGGGGDI